MTSAESLPPCGPTHRANEACSQSRQRRERGAAAVAAGRSSGSCRAGSLQILDAAQSARVLAYETKYMIHFLARKGGSTSGRPPAPAAAYRAQGEPTVGVQMLFTPVLAPYSGGRQTQERTLCVNAGKRRSNAHTGARVRLPQSGPLVRERVPAPATSFATACRTLYSGSFAQ